MELLLAPPAAGFRRGLQRVDQLAGLGAGIGLLLWGALAVSSIDNLVRILVISGVADTPVMLVLFGVLGGIASFGFIGLFVGPVILAILFALWREWAADNAHHRAPIGLMPPIAAP